jgi:hypothetical protein
MTKSELFGEFSELFGEFSVLNGSCWIALKAGAIRRFGENIMGKKKSRDGLAELLEAQQKNLKRKRALVRALVAALKTKGANPTRGGRAPGE